ncbi:30S ribosomal protein S8 [Corynebacterium variabile DSM 44702]|uniref:Small ribosomal subunit protein uS8 n=4 Tax=Corynebacterium variabile TaxID=1727 RepID=G0HGS8_CORVD|nr:30S ribosomal protein S8 [Corynebacterium variabile DSM 44702]
MVTLSRLRCDMSGHRFGAGCRRPSGGRLTLSCLTASVNRSCVSGPSIQPLCHRPSALMRPRRHQGSEQPRLLNQGSVSCRQGRGDARVETGTVARKAQGHFVMTMTDPIADMLSRVRNASNAYHDSVSMPSSKIKANIAEILKKEGYIADFTVEEAAKVGKQLILELKYSNSRERSIAGVRRVSKPGLRVYAKSTNLPRVLGGLGVAIISTSQGLLTDREATEKGVGGEVLAYVW